jgi:hypothetical protein
LLVGWLAALFLGWTLAVSLPHFPSPTAIKRMAPWHSVGNADQLIFYC